LNETITDMMQQSAVSNQQIVKIQDITNTSPDGETTRNGRKQ